MKNYNAIHEGLLPLTEEELATPSSAVVIPDVLVSAQNMELLPNVFKMNPQDCLSIIRPFIEWAIS